MQVLFTACRLKEFSATGIEDMERVKIMKKENIYKILYAVSICLIVVFIIMSGIDYYIYHNTPVNSAPFYLCIISRAAEFIIPSIIVFIIGKALRKKYK